MRTTKQGLDLIKGFEGFQSKAYRCPAGVPTIGYGCTFYLDGTHVRMTDDPITEAQAMGLLKEQLKYYEEGVNRYVKTKVTQSQFNALVSFIYNVGIGNFKNSTLLKKVNQDPNDKTIAHEFKRWNKCKGRILKVLTKRRCKESQVYFS